MDRPKPFSLETIFHAKYDYEKAQMLLLADFQRAGDAFADNRLFPNYSNLQKLHANLKYFASKVNQIDRDRSELAGVDWESKELKLAPPELDHEELEDVLDLMRWVKPYVSDALAHGNRVCKEAEESIEVNTVGVLPSYLQEGYLMLLDSHEERLNVHPYERKVLGSDETIKQDIRIKNPIKTVDFSQVARPLETIKKNAAWEHDWLPHPAAFHVKSSQPLPYKSTLAPVATKALSDRLQANA